MSMHQETIQAVSEMRSRFHSDKKGVFITGNFNIVHPGHLRLLQFASQCGDYVVVGVHPNGTEGALIEESLRLDGIKSISFVDAAFILRDSPEKFIQEFRPAFVVKGKEHESKLNPEHPVIESYGGKLLFDSGDMKFSSLDLLMSEFKKTNSSNIHLPSDYMDRHGFTKNSLLNTLNSLHSLKVTVLGDLIVDEYITCEALGMSQEDPTIVVSPINSAKFVGGAGIVAAHARGFGAQVRFLSISGDDETLRFADETLRGYGVQPTFLKDPSRPTPLKQRFRASGKTLLRVSHLRQHDIDQEMIHKMRGMIEEQVVESDLVIFSDFNYGCLPQNLVNHINHFCHKNQIPMVADSQSSSQVGDVSRFKKMLLLTPTEREARLAMRDFNSGLVVLAENLRLKAEASNIVMTLGSEGLIIHAPSKKSTDWMTDQLLPFNSAPKDTAGAGDSFLTCSSLALRSGADIWQSAYLGSIAAACQVGKIGNIPLNQQEIQTELTL